MRAVAAFLAVAICTLPTFASDPSSWAEYDREVAEACFKASGFKDPEAGSTVMLFDDSVGHDALIVSGTYPQAHMNNAKGEMLCLFNKATRTASVSEVMKPNKVRLTGDRRPTVQEWRANDPERVTRQNGQRSSP